MRAVRRAFSTCSSTLIGKRILLTPWTALGSAGFAAACLARSPRRFGYELVSREPNLQRPDHVDYYMVCVCAKRLLHSLRAQFRVCPRSQSLIV